jgi:hypothetical protein
MSKTHESVRVTNPRASRTVLPQGSAANVARTPADQLPPEEPIRPNTTSPRRQLLTEGKGVRITNPRASRGL